MTIESARENLYANLWVIKARWFYATAVLLLGLLANYDQSRAATAILPPAVLGLLFTLVILLNLAFYATAKLVETSKTYFGVSLLAVAQIAIELIFLTGIMFIIADFKTIVPVLFLIPIIESIVLFDRLGPALTAIFASLLLNGVLVGGVYLFPTESVDWSGLILTNTAPMTVVYLIIGFFASALAHLLKGRGQALMVQTSEQSHHVEQLEKLNKEFEQKANELYAKDVELTLANQRLQTLEAAKSKFIAVTTHQLRTPLAAVKWTFDMALKGQLGPIGDEQKDFFKKGFDSTQRIIAIVNQLLNAASFDNELEDKLKFVPTQLTDLLSSVIFEFANQAESKNIKLEAPKLAKTLPFIELDQVKIRMVLENLIDNAIKYTPKGGTVTITIDDAKINTANPSVDVVVTDTGIGIKPEDQKKVFEKFYRAANAVQVEPDGTGLGLFIGRDIIEKHHGTMWFVSEVGKGSKFYITLPINQPK